MIRMRKQLGPPLGQFVNCLWYSSGESKPHRKERLLPTGSVDLVCKLQEHRTVRIIHGETVQSIGAVAVSGAYSRFYAIDTSQPSPTIGVHFRPGGAAPFLGVPLSEVMDRHIRLDDLRNREAVFLRERLTEAKSVPVMFDRLEQTLLDWMTDPPKDYSAIMKAVKIFSSPTHISVKSVCESLDYRSKRFIRLFHDAVGLTPKLFCRINRFQLAVDRLAGAGHPESVNVALDCGYYDQSHLIREFRGFAGVTPLQYQPLESGCKNHIALNS